MKPSDITNNISEWFNGSGPRADVVISSRIRLARNVAGYSFLSRLTDPNQRQILEKLKATILSLDLGENVWFIDIDSATDIDRELLIERHLISRRHAKGRGARGAVIAESECFSAMINEEDHLRIQVIQAGLQLKECWEKISRYDDLIEDKVQFAFSKQYGYLTACPTNVGTGIRVSVMLHLPALKMTNQIDKFMNAARDMDFAVRGLFGEGSEAVGDFFQLSNQVTLGKSEMEIIEEFSDEIVPRIIDYELLARDELIKKKSHLLDDKIQRALGVLKSAHMISSKEALFLLSNVRMGVNLKRITGISISTVNELFMLTLPGHLQANSGSKLDADGRDLKRAQIIRGKLSLN